MHRSILVTSRSRGLKPPPPPPLPSSPTYTRLTRRSRVGIQFVKYPAVISRRRKSFSRRWRLMHESADCDRDWVTSLLTRCVFCAPIIRRTNSRIELQAVTDIWLKTTDLTVLTFHRSCIKINSIGLLFSVTSACSDLSLLRRKWFQRKFAW